jgi:hypothetical protein
MFVIEHVEDERSDHGGLEEGLSFAQQLDTLFLDVAMLVFKNLEEDSSIETDFLAVVLFLDHLWQDLDD